jgi:O-antigen/teichoic acid export membrane protein
MAPASLPARSTIARSSILNLLGAGAPLLVALFAIPVLAGTLGADRFGVLNLAWVILGYFSLFDLGLGRAMTKLVAEKLGLGEEERIPALVWNSLLLMLVFGLVGSIVALAISPWLVRDALKIPLALQSESLPSFYLLALSIPVVTSGAGLRGLLEAKQRFDLINMVRIPHGGFSFLAPIAVLPFSHSLFPIVTVLVAGQIIAWVVYLLLCLRVLPELRGYPVLTLSAVSPLLRFGTWMSVSNIISPLMVTLDRFVIGAMISVSAVAYYGVAYQTVTKLWIIPGALTGVLFPAFASVWVQDDERAAGLLRKSVKSTFLLLFPIILVIVTLGHEGLNVWLGPEYAQHSTRVLQWLAIGVFLNCLAQIPFALIQAAGRPDLTARFHLIELPLYLVALWALIRGFGIDGAAMAWTMRCGLDAVLLFVAVRPFFRIDPFSAKRFALVAAAALTTMAAGAVVTGRLSKIVLLGSIIPLFIILGWHRVLTAEDRSRIAGFIESRKSRIEEGPSVR